MSAFQRRLYLLDYIPRQPQKISTRRLLALLEQNGHENLLMRTIQRDLESIESLGGFGLESDKRSKPFGWYISANWKRLNISLMDANTALAFSTLEHFAEMLLPESTREDLSEYFRKADTILKSDQTPLISHWKNSVVLASNSLPVKLPEIDKNTFSMIKKALFHQKQISAQLKRFIFKNSDPVWKSYNHVNILGLAYKEGSPIVVISFGSFHQKSYSFPLAYIKDVVIEVPTTVMLNGFDLKNTVASQSQHIDTASGIKLELKVRKDCFFILRDAKLSPDQQVENSDEVESVFLTATVADTPQLRAFLRGLGNSVEVLSPEPLREYFTALSRKLFEKYAAR